MSHKITEALYLFEGNEYKYANHGHTVLEGLFNKYGIGSIVYIPHSVENGELARELISAGYEVTTAGVVGAPYYYDDQTMASSVQFVIMNVVMSPGHKVAVVRELNDGVGVKFIKQILKELTLSNYTIEEIIKNAKSG